jgi:hypothetical protein
MIELAKAMFWGALIGVIVCAIPLGLMVRDIVRHERQVRKQSSSNGDK